MIQSSSLFVVAMIPTALAMLALPKRRNVEEV
jgi:hypothetical protein